MMTVKRILLLRIVSPILQEIDHPVHCYPSLTLKYIQALLARENSYDIKLIDGRVNYLKSEEITEKILSYKPDVLVIFSNFISPDSILSLCKRAKESLNKLFVITIGPVATWNRKILLLKEASVDVVIPGEPEERVLDLINQLASNKKTPDYYRSKFKDSSQPFIVNELDNLPYPQFSKQELSKYPFIYPVRLNKKVYCGYMETSRGCAHKCIFCSQYIRKTYGNIVRLKDPKRVVDEMKCLMNNGANFISFTDDDFSFSRSHVISICDQIKRQNLNIKWAAEARVDEIDKELLILMKEAGCEFLQFGVESGSERIIDFLKKTDKPTEWIPECRRVFSLTRQMGIASCAMFIIGSPEETEEEIQKSMNFAADLNPNLIKLHFFSFYPGSEVRESFSEELAKLEDRHDIYHHDFPYLNQSKIDSNRLIKLRKEFYRKIFLNHKFIINHLRRYSLYYLYNRDNFGNLASRTMKLFQGI